MKRLGVVPNMILIMAGGCLLTLPPDMQGQTGSAQLYADGIGFARQGRFAEAEAELKKARELDPSNLDILTALGKVEGKLGESADSIAIFRESVVLAPKAAEAHENLGVALADGGQLDQALEQISISLRLNPRQPSTHLARARLLVDMHRADDAAKEFALVTTLAPDDPKGYYYWALLARDKGDSSTQTRLLKSVVRLQPGNAHALYLLGCSLADASKEVEAIQAWRAALDIEPDSIEVLYRLSRALHSTDPTESAALQSRLQALQKRKESLESIEALGNQGYLAMKAEKWQDAIIDFREALGMCGDCAVASGLHKDLGLALCRIGDTRTGREELEVALRLNPDDPDIVKALSSLESGSVQ